MGMTCVVGHRNLPYKANLKISLISDPNYLELDLGRNVRVVVCTKLHICGRNYNKPLVLL